MALRRYCLSIPSSCVAVVRRWLMKVSLLSMHESIHYAASERLAFVSRVFSCAPRGVHNKSWILATY